MRLKYASISLVLIFLFVLTSLPVFGQESAVSGSISGTVLDKAGAVVTGATVTLIGPQGNNSSTTNDEGRFFFGTLTLGTYSVKIEKQGFRTAEVNAVQVLTGRTAVVAAKLEPGTVTEVVEVSSTAVAVDTTSTAVQTNLPDSFYQSVPVARNVAGLFYVAPGAADGGGTGRSNPSVSGASGLENMYTADGVNITDSAFGGLGVFTRRQGSIGSGINLSFIKEVNVKTSAFEPQYGQADGGLVQLVTKSGTNRYHGEIGAYFAPNGAQASWDQTDAVRTNKTGFNYGYANYDLDGELGGYIPGAKNHLFFFGSFDPTWNQQFVGAATGSGLESQFPNGLTLFSRVMNYAGKLTWVINDRHKIEASVFGDPSSTNTSQQNFVLNTPNDTAMSHWNYGTRNFVTRYNGTLSNSWLVNASFTWNTNDFTEYPKYDTLQVSNRTDPTNIYALQGFGMLENHQNTTYGFSADTQKIVNKFGQHTFSIGYHWENPNYNDLSLASGGFYNVPNTNASGGSYLNCSAGDPACPLGQKEWLWSGTLRTATSACTLCPLYPVKGVLTPVYVQFGRGRFDSGITPTVGKGQAAYFNDTWRATPKLTFNLGVRWEQWHMEGTGSAYTFTGNWAPRLGVSYDPWGDGKTKIFFNYAQYNYWTPLDAAVRSLSGEKDIISVRLAPASTNGIVDVNSNGSVNLPVDAAHILNSAVGGVGGNPSVGASTFGTGFAPGSKLMYQTEYVYGLERQMKGGFVISARFVYRYMPRALDDIAGISPESYVNNPNMTQFYYITNPGPGTDLFPNEHEKSYTPGNAASQAAAGCSPAAIAAETAYAVDQVVDGNGGTINPATGGPWNNGNGVCWTKVNGYWGGEQGADGQPIPDGVPDGFPKVYHNYRAVEVEVNKSFANNWSMRANWRLAYLTGNYEGAYRNDNGQTDPNISSLFDFTNGIIGMLGDQYQTGPLNTDRLSILNIYTTYVPSKSFLKGFDFGIGLNVLSGTPVSQLANHPAYLNSGEIPLGGRGSLGRTPISGGLNLHADRVVKVNEWSALHLTADLFNVTNSQPVKLYDQNYQISGSPALNVDFDKVAAWQYQRPFYARFAVRWVF